MTFEVFIGDYLRKRLGERFSERVVDSLFDHFRSKRMEDIAGVLFQIATRNTLREALKKARREEL